MNTDQQVNSVESVSIKSIDNNNNNIKNKNPILVKKGIQSKIEIRRLNSKTNNLLDNKQISEKNAYENTQFFIRFEDNLKQPTNTNKSVKKEKKITLLSNKFTTLQNDFKNVNILGWQLEDTSRSSDQRDRSNLAEFLNILDTQYKRDSKLEDPKNKSINPVHNALIELITKKINENKRTSVTAETCEKNMKMASFISKELKNLNNKVSDSFKLSRIHNSNVSFSMNKQIQLKTSKAKSKPAQTTVKQSPTHSIKPKKPPPLPPSLPPLPSLPPPQHTQSEPLKFKNSEISPTPADLNLFNDEHVRLELVRNVTEHEVNSIQDMLNSNKQDLSFTFSYFLDSNQKADHLKQATNKQLDSNRIESIMVNFTCLLISCLIRICELYQRKINDFQKQYEDLIVHDPTNSLIKSNLKEFQSKKSKITKFLANFDMIIFSKNDPAVEYLKTNLIYKNIYECLKIKSTQVHYLNNLIDYLDFMDKYYKQFLKLNNDHQQQYVFSIDFKLFLYDLMHELNLNQIEYSLVSRDLLTSLVSPIKLVILTEPNEKKLVDPRMKIDKSNHDFKPIDKSNFSSLFGCLDKPFSKEYPFDESLYRKTIYTKKVNCFTSKSQEMIVYDNWIKEIKEANSSGVNISDSFIPPPTPRLRYDDSLNLQDTSLFMPNLSEIIQDLNSEPMLADVSLVKSIGEQVVLVKPESKDVVIKESNELSINASCHLIEEDIKQLSQAESPNSEKQVAQTNGKNLPNVENSKSIIKSQDMKYISTLASLNPYDKTNKRKWDISETSSSDEDYQIDRSFDRKYRRLNRSSETKTSERRRERKFSNRYRSRSRTRSRSRSREPKRRQNNDNFDRTSRDNKYLPASRLNLSVNNSKLDQMNIDYDDNANNIESNLDLNNNDINQPKSSEEVLEVEEYIM